MKQKKKKVKVAHNYIFYQGTNNSLYRFGENASKQNTLDTAKVKMVDNNFAEIKLV